MKKIKALGLILITATVLMLGHLFDDRIMPHAVANSTGETLYTQKLCVTCHGNGGRQPIGPLYPKINGQNVQYSLQQMKDIRDGKRTNGISSVMKPLVANITDEEMQAIAEYLATQR